MSLVLSTLHIFGYGEVQVIGKDGNAGVNKKVPVGSLSGVKAVVDNVYSQKPADNNSPNIYHAVNIFDGLFADYQVPGEFKSFRVEFDKLDKSLIDALVAEVVAYLPPVVPK